MQDPKKMYERSKVSARKMVSIVFMVFMLFSMLLLSACSQDKKPEEITVQADSEFPPVLPDMTVKINKVNVDAKEEGAWWVVSQDAEFLTIDVEAENADAVLFWSVPTGTNVGKERELVGYDVDGDDGWSLKWNIKGQTFHNHVEVQALGTDSRTLASETFNLHTESEYDN